MPRSVQGSGAFGHVGWVREVDPDGAGVTLVSMNRRGRDVITAHHVLVDGLVAFISPPTGWLNQTAAAPVGSEATDAGRGGPGRAKGSFAKGRLGSPQSWAWAEKTKAERSASTAAKPFTRS